MRRLRAPAIAHATCHSAMIAMFRTWLTASPSTWYRDRVVLGELAGFPQRAAALAAKPSLMLVLGEPMAATPSAMGIANSGPVQTGLFRPIAV